MKYKREGGSANRETSPETGDTIGTGRVNL